MSKYKKYTYLTGITMLLLLLMMGLNQAGLFNSVERTLLDSQFRIFPREDTTKKATIISIDEKSLGKFAKNRIYWPWPREFYHILLDYLNQQGAEVVVFDILFITPDFDRTAVNGEISDKRFMESMKRFDRTAIALKTTEASKLPDSPIQPENPLFDLSMDGDPPDREPHSYLSLPLPKFRQSAAMLGNTNVLGNEDGIIREIALFEHTSDGNPIPSLAIAPYLLMQDDTTTIAWKEQTLRVGNRFIPFQPDGRYLINWYKKGGVNDGTFSYYSFSDVMQSALAKMRSEGTPIVPDGTFSDKVVFIGASAAGLSDIKSTPLSSLEDFPGVEILATAFTNFVDGQFIKQPNSWALYSIALLIIVLMIGITSYFRPLKGSIYSLGVLLLLITAGIFLFITYRYWIPLGFYMSNGFLAFTTGLGYRYFTEEKAKMKLKSAFNHYVQPELVEEIAKHPDSLQLGGNKKNLSIMFNDLAGFTTLSEKLEPTKLVSLLNDYLSEMTDIIFSHNGTVDKFIGDAIMAFWGAPIEQNDHAIQTCRATLAMTRRLKELNKIWGNNDRPQLKARFGINTGTMIVGNMGSSNRFNYTVIGDAVNLAARLEPLNTFFGTEILISEQTYYDLSGDFICRKAGQFIVKGKEQVVTAYELCGDRMLEDVSEHLELISHYRNGLRLFYNRNWNESKQIFEEILEQNPQDSLTKKYYQHCINYLEQPPGEEWQGIFDLSKTK